MTGLGPSRARKLRKQAQRYLRSLGYKILGGTKMLGELKIIDDLRINLISEYLAQLF